MNLQSILLSDDIVKSINDNINDLLFVIPEIKYMIGFKHNHPYHQNNHPGVTVTVTGSWI